jgi:hypothetical protein
MTGLHDLQKAFQAYLLNPAEQMSERVVSDEQLSDAGRLGIYAKAYRLRLSEALGTDFPALHTLLGDAGFTAMARAYIEACPSRHFSIRWFGHQLSAFLSTHSEYKGKPVLAEMAAFEWALSHALDAADAPCLGVADLAGIPLETWPDLRFALHPSITRLDLWWNAPILWKAIDAKQPPQAPERSDTLQAWLVWRQDLASYFKSLDVAEAAALDTLRAGGCFAQICEGLCETVDEEEVPLHAAQLLQHWLAKGLIAALESAR